MPCKNSDNEKKENTVIIEAIHPLVQVNRSNLAEQKFASKFNGTEFFLSDHKVNGDNVLPGVAYLEMAYTAVWNSLKFEPGTKEVMLKIEDVVWNTPLAVNKQAVTVQIVLFPEEEGRIRYDVLSSADNLSTVKEEQIIHSQGIVKICGCPKLEEKDLIELKRSYPEEFLNPSEYYQIFREMGIEYGPAQQGIGKLYQGKTGILAKLELPDCVSDTLETYVLHPSIMDAVLQASAGLLAGTERGRLSGLLLPFALEELSVISGCRDVMWAEIQYAEEVNSEKVKKVNATLYDDKGRCCIFMRGITFRELEKREKKRKFLLMEPHFVECPLEEKDKKQYEHRIIFNCFKDSKDIRLTETKSGAEQINLSSSSENRAKRFQEYATPIVQTLQEVMRKKTKGKVLVQIISEPAQEISGFLGLLNTAHLENPNIEGQVIELDHWENREAILEWESKAAEKGYIRYQEGRRFIKKWKEIMLKQNPNAFTVPWKDSGTYLITGGMGGIGMIFARDLAEKTKHAKVILTGRSKQTKEITEKIRELEKTGIQVEYKEADMGDMSQAKAMAEDIKARYHGLNGIIQGAGIIKDGYILEKNPDEISEVLWPKVNGTVNLDEVTKEMELDFFVLFSSITGVMGNLGQADYAMANAFMDSYAAIRNEMVINGKRSGKTVSINWPLWENGGMQVKEKAKAILNRNGILTLDNSQGLIFFYCSLNQDIPQILVIPNASELLNHLPFAAESKNMDFPMLQNQEDNFYFSTIEGIKNGLISEEQVEKLLMHCE